MFFRYLFVAALTLHAGTASSQEIFLTAGTAPPPGPDSSPMEEIVVTAGFRDGELMSTGGSISVLEPALIEERGARHLEDTLAVAPNVNYSVGGSRARFIQIRGVGDLEQFVDPKHYPAVGVVMDGIELSNVATSALLFDTERVEVYRGPQGTRFGASALAGLVNIVGRDPGDVLEGRVDAGYGNLDSWYLAAAGGGPLGENLGVRVSVRQNMRDGFIHNDFLGRNDTQDVDELSARAKLVWDLSPNLRAYLTTLYIDADNGYDAFSLNNSRTTLTDEPGSDDQEVLAVAGRLHWDGGQHGVVQLTTTWTDAEETYGFDEDWVFGGFCDGVRCNPLVEFMSSDTIDREREQVSVDVRWLTGRGAWSWVAGAYFHARDEDMARQRFGLFSSRYETRRYALYGELELAVSEHLSARLGVRGEAFADEYSDTNAFDLQSNDTFWSGEATVEYEAGNDTLLYATLSRGARPGGVNTGATSVQPFVAARFQPFITERRQFSTESLFNKEIGLKGRYVADRVALRLTVFHMDRADAQLESFLYDATTFIFVGMLDNVDDAENYGVEFEMDAWLSDTLTFSSRVGYLETNIERMTVFDLDLDDFRALEGRDQTKAPRWQYHFGLRWQIMPTLTGNVSVEGRDDSFFGFYHDERLDGYTLMNASLAYTWRGVKLRAWSRNLLNTQYAVHGLYFANDPRDGFAVNRAYEQRGEPRVYGIDMSYAF